MALLLAESGCGTEICQTVADLCHRIPAGAGALLLTEEALQSPQISELFALLKAQPPWSELPLIIITSGRQSRLSGLLNQASAAAGSMTLLERPLGAATLLRSVEVALRSRRRQYEIRDLLHSKARLAAIVESSDDAIFSIDIQGTITTWNRGAERLFGYTAEEAIGQPITILIPEERLVEETAIMRCISRGECVMSYETVRRCKNGELLDISLTVSPIRDADGVIRGASKISRDITARKRTERELADAQAKLRERAADLERAVQERTADLRATNEQLDAFVYSIAHDLRAPLRSITGLSHLLMEDQAKGLSEEGLNLLNRIQTASVFMDRLLLDLLVYGRTSRGEIELTPVDLRAAWEAAQYQCASAIQQEQAVVETIEPLPTVIAHQATLTQCLANLLSNALKFVEPGAHPRVRLRAEDRQEMVRVWVEDNGIGIPPDQYERVFRVFERLHGSRYTGTGIGLSIVRKGIERMGGHSGVESEPGKGSRFWIELPKAPSPAA